MFFSEIIFRILKMRYRILIVTIIRYFMKLFQINGYRYQPESNQSAAGITFFAKINWPFIIETEGDLLNSAGSNVSFAFSCLIDRIRNLKPINAINKSFCYFTQDFIFNPPKQTQLNLTNPINNNFQWSIPFNYRCCGLHIFWALVYCFRSKY